MNKDIENQLKKINKSWRISSKSNFALEGNTLIITLDEVAVSSNMQNNEAAFEAWAICLRTHLPELIQNVVLRFDEKVECLDNPHFNRCLYRLDKFRKAYPWVIIDEKIEQSIPNYGSMNLLLNFPSSPALPAQKCKSEAALERMLVQTNPMKMDVIDHQMPIGVFREKVSKGIENIYMNSGHAALDLWGIKDDNLYLYELKKEDNERVGIISELMFYTNIFTDVRKGLISYPKDSEQCTLRHFQDFKNIITSNSALQINSIMIAPKLHSMITSNVINAINDSKYYKENNITFRAELLK